MPSRRPLPGPSRLRWRWSWAPIGASAPAAAAPAGTPPHKEPNRFPRQWEPRRDQRSPSWPALNQPPLHHEAMSPTPYLELEGVAAHLGERRVFDNLSLRLNLGEHTVVLGPNGAGKSALVKLISREIYPVVQQGSHLRLFSDRTVNLWQLRQRIGLVTSDFERLYNPKVCANDVVLSGCFGSVGIGRSQNPTPAMQQRVAELMDQLGLLELAKERF